MKTTQTILIFAAGLVAGIGGMLAVDSFKDDSPASGDDGKQAKLEKRSKSHASGSPGSGKKERAKLADRPKVAKEGKEDSGREDNLNPLKLLKSSGIQLDENFLKQIQKQHDHKQQKEIAAKLATLKARLSLSPEQEAKIRKLLEANGNQELAIMRAALNPDEDGGDNKGKKLLELIKTSSPRKPVDEEIRDLLDSDQIAAYDEYQEERRRNNIEISANRQLTGLQSMFTLTDEQKDAAYEVFTRQAEERYSTMASLDSALGTTAVIAGGSSDNEPLRDILTEEQFEAYNANSANAFLSGAGIPTTGANATIMLNTSGDGEGSAITTGAVIRRIEVRTESLPKP